MLVLPGVLFLLFVEDCQLLLLLLVLSSSTLSWFGILEERNGGSSLREKEGLEWL